MYTFSALQIRSCNALRKNTYPAGNVHVPTEAVATHSVALIATNVTLLPTVAFVIEPAVAVVISLIYFSKFKIRLEVGLLLAGQSAYQKQNL